MSDDVSTEDGEGRSAGTLRPLESPRPLAEDAADRIRAGILEGTFRQGEHLVEARIARQLHVSRGPVREAFKLLRAEGLVEEEPRRGTFVVNLSPSDVREIYDLRAAIEARAAERLAGAHEDLHISELHDRIATMDAAVKAGDMRGVSRADLQFHEAVCRLSGNRRLLEVFQRYVPMLRVLLKVDEYVYRSSIDEIAAQHRPLLEAIEEGNPSLAASRFAEHVDTARTLVTEYIAKLSEG